MPSHSGYGRGGDAIMAGRWWWTDCCDRVGWEWPNASHDFLGGTFLLHAAHPQGTALLSMLKYRKVRTAENYGSLLH